MDVTARQSVFAPLQVEGAVEAIVRRIGEAIGSGVLEPGERLPSEGELAARLAVGPMTLRQALANLRGARLLGTPRGRSQSCATPASSRRAAAGVAARSWRPTPGTRSSRRDRCRPPTSCAS